MQHSSGRKVAQEVERAERTFVSYAQQLQHAGLQIARLSELADAKLATSEDWRAVHDIASATLVLSEGFILQAKLHAQLETPSVQPIAIGALLYDAAHTLHSYASRLGVEIQVQEVPRSTELVMTDPAVTQLAMVGVGQLLIQATAEGAGQGPVSLAAHKSRYGTVAGVYGQQFELDAATLRRARALHGKASQPYTKLVSGPAAGLYIAENLLNVVSAHLHVARYKTLVGLATTLQTCNQLQLV